MSIEAAFTSMPNTIFYVAVVLGGDRGFNCLFFFLARKSGAHIFVHYLTALVRFLVMMGPTRRTTTKTTE